MSSIRLEMLKDIGYCLIGVLVIIAIVGCVVVFFSVVRHSVLVALFLGAILYLFLELAP